MEEIGNLFILTRESAGISLKEVSEDLDVEEALLENIEDGKSGAFSDVFKLKEYVYNYAKYLGLDADKVVDEFNEFVFTSTSKIPVKEIEKEIAQIEKKEDKNEIISPYTKKEVKTNDALFLIICILLVVALIFAIFWSVKTITISNQVANSISGK